MEAINKQYIEIWLTSGEKILRKKERLTSPNDTPDTNALSAFNRLYYGLENLSFGEYKKCIDLLKKRRANLSSDDYKKTLGDFLANSELLFSNETEMRKVVACMKKEGQLPYDDSEARRKNEENLRRVREEHERKERERKEREQREQREQRERERQEQERKRQQEEAANEVWCEQVLDNLSEQRAEFVMEQLKSKKRKKKIWRWCGIAAAVVLAIIGSICFLQGDGKGLIPERRQLEKKQKEIADRLLASDWKRVDEKATIDFISVDSNQVVAELVQQQKYNKQGKPMQHTLKGTINPTCDTLFLTDEDKTKWVDLSLFLVLNNQDSLLGEYTQYSEKCCQFVVATP